MDYIPVDQYIYTQPHISSVVMSGSSALSCSNLTDAINSYSKGNNFLLNKQFQAAITQYDRVIKQLGDQYYSPNIQDDTGLKLTLANAEQKKQNFERAAYLKRNILESRLTLFKEKNNCQDQL